MLFDVEKKINSRLSSPISTSLVSRKKERKKKKNYLFFFICFINWYYTTIYIVGVFSLSLKYYSNLTIMLLSKELCELFFCDNTNQHNIILIVFYYRLNRERGLVFFVLLFTLIT